PCGPRQASEGGSSAGPGEGGGRLCPEGSDRGGAIEPAEGQPAVAELAPLLRDAGGREPERPADVQGALAEHEPVDQAAVAAGVGEAAGGEVDLERDLLGDRGGGVVPEGLVQRAAVQRAEVGQPADGEAVAAPGERAQGVLAPLLARQAAAGPD